MQKQPDQKINGRELADLEWLKFDRQILLTPIRKWGLQIILLSILVGWASFSTARHFLPDLYHTEAILVRHNRVVTPQSPFPAIYAPMDLYSAVDVMSTANILKEVEKKLKNTIDIQELSKSVKIENKSSLLHVKVKNPSVEKSVLIANTYAESFLHQIKDQQKKSTEEMFLGYKEEEGKISAEINSLKNEILKLSSYADGRDVKQSSVSSNEIVIDLKGKVRELEISKNKNIEVLSFINKQIKRTPKNILNEKAYLEKKNALSESLYELRQRYTEENPKVKRAIIQLKNLNRNDLNAMREKNPAYLDLLNRKTSLQSENAGISASLKTYTKMLSFHENEMNRINEKRRIIEEKEKSIEKQKLLLNKLQNTRTELQISTSIQNQDYEISELAIPSPHPVIQLPVKLSPLLGILFAGASYCFILLTILWRFPILSTYDFKNILGTNKTFIFPTWRLRGQAYYNHLNGKQKTKQPFNKNTSAKTKKNHARRKSLFLNNLYKLSQELIDNASKRSRNGNENPTSKNIGTKIFFASDSENSGKENLLRALAKLWRSENQSLYIIHVLFPFFDKHRLPLLNNYLHRPEQNSFVRFFSSFRGDADGVWHGFVDLEPLLDFPNKAKKDIGNLVSYFGKNQTVLFNVEGFKYQPAFFSNLVSQMDSIVLVAESGKSKRTPFKKLYQYLSDTNSIDGHLSSKVYDHLDSPTTLHHNNSQIKNKNHPNQEKKGISPTSSPNRNLSPISTILQNGNFNAAENIHQLSLPFSKSYSPTANFTYHYPNGSELERNELERNELENTKFHSPDAPNIHIENRDTQSKRNFSSILSQDSHEQKTISLESIKHHRQQVPVICSLCNAKEPYYFSNLFI